MTHRQLEAAVTDKTTIWPKYLTDKANDEQQANESTDDEPDAEP